MLKKFFNWFSKENKIKKDLGAIPLNIVEHHTKIGVCPKCGDCITSASLYCNKCGVKLNWN